MNMDDLHTSLDERFGQLPEAVQNAITSADTAVHLRKLSDSNQLHVDQWQELETEVMMTLMGLKPVSALEQNIKKNVHVDDATAAQLTKDISEIVFAPVRDELERFLSHPSAHAKEGEPIKDMTTEILKSAAGGAAPVVEEKPAQPAAPTVVRKEAPEAYKPGQPSTARAEVHTDPYREPPDV